MTPEALISIHDFFERYTESYLSNASNKAPYALKREHTFRVRDNIRCLGKALGLDAATLRLGEAAGLLHDVGRFPQFRDHGTFRDAVSVNHGLLGCETIKTQGVLDRLSHGERTHILAAVEYHNAYHLPLDMAPDALFLTRLVRDGDKLDILQVMGDKYQKDINSKENAFITMDLAQDGAVSPVLVEKIRQGQMLDNRQVSSLNDLKLLQLSWVFDFNFPSAYLLLEERNLMGQILSSLPQTEEILSLKAFLMDGIKAGAKGRSPIGSGPHPTNSWAH